MKRQEYTEKLVHLYKDTFKKEGQLSECYYQTKPTIPWIGDHYGEHRILIYASAENLNDDWIRKGKNKSLFYGEEAFNRHARFWECDEKIRIEPFDTGGLWLVGIMCLRKLGFEVPPMQDITTYVAVANLSKFSLKRIGKRNNDVGEKELTPSWVYIKHDIEVLRPRIVINASGKKNLQLFKEHTPSLHVVDLPQYTDRQLGFYHLRKKVSCCEVQEFRPLLTSLIKEYSGQLKKVEKKISDGTIKNDDFVRYFCLVQQRLAHADCLNRTAACAVP